MQYDALKDFDFISLMARAPIILYTHPGFAPKNLKELAALAKQKPGTLNFASAGVGSMTHLTGESFKMLAGIDKTHILYRGGTPAMNDLLAGQIPMQYGTVAQALPQYKAGLLKALAISSAQRYASVPEIPTFREQGFDVVTTEWFGLLAPAGTPKPVIAKLNAEIKRIMALPNMGDRLSAIELTSSTPEELKAFIASEIDRWGPVIKKLGLKID
jgi:tripartite-type tricarboxylate transporter receptor subunit TctC